MIPNRIVSTLTASLIASTLLACFASVASAQLTYFVRPTDQTGSIVLPGQFLAPGDQLRLDVTLRSDGAPVAGVGASATDYASNNLAFNSGTGVATVLAEICFPGIGCLGGLTGASDVDGPLSENTLFGPQAVRFFNHISIAPAHSDGATDEGWDGTIGSAQAQIVFDVVGAGLVFGQGASISVGTFAALGDAVIPGSGGTGGTWQTVWIVPEPGTAMLLGLGLMSLTRGGRAAGGV